MMAAGCAIGAPVTEGTNAPPLTNPSGMPMIDAATSVPDEVVPNDLDSGMTTFVGDACERGAMEPCACEGSTAMGQRICTANLASPPSRPHRLCSGCPAPDAGSVDQGGASGMSGVGGMGGASGMSSGSGGATPTGGMGGGAGGMAGAGGAPACACTDLLACCRADGSCGVGVPELCI